MWKSLTSAAFVALIAAAPYAARTVSGHEVASTLDPAVRIGLPRAAGYAGTDAWTLYGIADCQIFIFAEAGAGKNVRALYWVQFEAYVPSMPKLAHTYDSPHHTTLGGKDFFVDTWVESSAPSPPHADKIANALKSLGYAVPKGIDSGSDYQHVVALLHARGYVLPERMASLRLVHLLDPQKRKELMIIYGVPAGSGETDGPALRQRLLREAHERIGVFF